MNNDDDEEELTPAKRKKTVKVEKEEGKENGEEQSAYLFKMETGENGVIDLENDRYVCHHGLSPYTVLCEFNG